MSLGGEEIKFLKERKSCTRRRGNHVPGRGEVMFLGGEEAIMSCGEVEVITSTTGEEVKYLEERKSSLQEERKPCPQKERKPSS